MPQAEITARPVVRNAWPDAQYVAADTQTSCYSTIADTASRRSRCTSSSRYGRHVLPRYRRRTGDVGFNLVALDRGGAVGVADRVQHGQQFAGFVTVTELGEGDRRPDHAVGVLAAVFAQAWRVALDVAGVVGAIVKAGVNSAISRASRSTAMRSTAAIACVARSRLAARASTLQDCAIVSIWHSSSAADPSVWPSSYHPRRHQPPSQAWVSAACDQCIAPIAANGPRAGVRRGSSPMASSR